MPIGVADMIGRADPTEFVSSAILDHFVTWTGHDANDEFFARCFGRFVWVIEGIFSLVVLVLFSYINRMTLPLQGGKLPELWRSTLLSELLCWIHL